MKFLQILLILMSIVFNKEQPQHKINGKYVNKFGHELVIKGDRLILNLHEGVLYGTDTIADCTITRISEEIFEINSEPFLERQQKVQSSLTIEQSYDPDLKDSIRIEVRVNNGTYIYAELKTSFVDREFMEFFNGHNPFMKQLHIKDGIGSVNLPGDIIKLVYIYFEPERIPFDGFDPLFRGYAYQSVVLDTLINNGKNVIKISIPAMDEGFFAKYYVRGEYVRIKENSLIWRGIEYKKK